MRSLAKRTKRSKKTKRLGPVQVLRPDEYAAFDVETKVECIQALLPLGLMRIRELLEDAVRSLAGLRYQRKAPSGLPGYRHGSNPGSVQLAGQRHSIKLPRVQAVEGGGELALESLSHLRGTGMLDEVLLKQVLYGVSCRNYEAAAIPGAMGLSSSAVSRRFTQASAKQLKGLQERDLSKLAILAIFLAGKTFADLTMVVAVGITLTGDKHGLGFVETGTENEAVLTPFLQELEERGRSRAQGLLCIIDGGKGLRAAVRQAFETSALVQRCQWRKREKVVRHLPKGDQALWRRRGLQRASQRSTYAEAKTALARLQTELEDRNQSAARSVAEG